MKLSRQDADIFVPSGTALDEALGRVTLMGVSAHQDDLEIMAYHGILRGFREPDEAFAGVVVCDGAGGARDGVHQGHSGAEMAQVRRQEQRQAAELGAYALMLQLGHPSAAAKDPLAGTVVDDLEAVLRAARPREVYTHNLADRHDTHVAVVLKLVTAIRRLPPALRPQKLIGCEVWRDLDWMNDADKVVMPVDGPDGLADALMGVFKSQIQGNKRYDLATQGRRRAHATFADSHAAEGAQNLIYGMDLSPLMREDGPGPGALVERYLASFRAEVQDRMERLG